MTRSMPRSSRPASRGPTRKMRMRARELFACALETPGGLKVQTIHALCTRLLQQFPFEANVPARFAVLDDRDQNEMMERANLAVLLDASRDPDSAAGRALHDRDGECRRRHFQGRGARGVPEPRSFHGLDRRRRQRRRRCGADGGGARRRSRRRVSRTSSARSSTDRICRDRAGKRSPCVLDTGSKSDQGQAIAACAKRWYSSAAPRSMNISACSSPMTARPRKTRGDQEIQRQQSGHRAACSKRRALRIGPLIERRRAVTARDRTRGAAADRDRGGGELPARKAGARPARL